MGAFLVTFSFNYGMWLGRFVKNFSVSVAINLRHEAVDAFAARNCINLFLICIKIPHDLVASTVSSFRFTGALIGKFGTLGEV